MNPENALVRREVVFERDDIVTLIEVWDTAHPDSPFVQWGRDKPDNPYCRAFKMRAKEFAASGIALKLPETALSSGSVDYDRAYKVLIGDRPDFPLIPPKPTKFDRTTYQREYMRKRRAENKPQGRSGKARKAPSTDSGTTVETPSVGTQSAAPPSSYKGYKDPEARKAYMREKMRQRRAKAKP